MPFFATNDACSVAKSTIGYMVFGGMLVDPLLTIIIVQVLFVLITNRAYSKEKLAELNAKREAFMKDTH